MAVLDTAARPSMLTWRRCPPTHPKAVTLARTLSASLAHGSGMPMPKHRHGSSQMRPGSAEAACSFVQSADPPTNDPGPRKAAGRSPALPGAALSSFPNERGCRHGAVIASVASMVRRPTHRSRERVDRNWQETRKDDQVLTSACPARESQWPPAKRSGVATAAHPQRASLNAGRRTARIQSPANPHASFNRIDALPGCHRQR